MRLKVEVKLEEQGVVTAWTETASTASNVSGEFRGARGYKGFQLSPSKEEPLTPLGRGYTFFGESGYPGWLGTVAGSLDAPQFEVTFDKATDLIRITFDAVLGEYATSVTFRYLTILRTVVTCTGPTCVVKLQRKATKATIIPQGWSNPNSAMKVTSIEGLSSITFQGTAVESVECSEQAWGGAFKIDTGVLQQYADISLRDYDGTLASLSDLGELSSALPITLSVEYKKEWFNLGTYVSDTWSVDKVENRVKVACSDYTRNFSKNVLDVVGEDISVKDLFAVISAQIPEVDIIPKPDGEVVDIVSGDSLSTENYLASCVCRDIYFQAVDAETIISELCDRWLLRLYWQADIQKYVIMEAW